MASSRQRYEHSKFNLAAQGHRQPGSTFKAVRAHDRNPAGIDPTTTLLRRPSNSHPGWRQPRRPDLRGADLRRTTYSGAHQPRLGDAQVRQHRLRAARPRPRPEERSRRRRKEMGITTQLDGYPAEGLGGLTPRRLAARDGRTPTRRSPTAACTTSRSRSPGWSSRTATRGHGWAKPAAPVLRPTAITDEATKILAPERAERHRHARATSAARRPARPARRATSTTPGSSATRPSSPTAVWVGYPNAKVPMTNVHGISVHGRHLPRADLARLHVGRPWARLLGLRARQAADDVPAVLREVLDHRPARRRAREGQEEEGQEAQRGAGEGTPTTPTSTSPSPRAHPRPSRPPPPTRRPIRAPATRGPERPRPAPGSRPPPQGRGSLVR